MKGAIVFIVVIVPKPNPSVNGQRLDNWHTLQEPAGITIRKGDKIARRLSLQVNPSEKTDFFIEPKPNQVYDFKPKRVLPRRRKARPDRHP